MATSRSPWWRTPVVGGTRTTRAVEGKRCCRRAVGNLSRFNAALRRWRAGHVGRIDIVRVSTNRAVAEQLGWGAVRRPWLGQRWCHPSWLWLALGGPTVLGATLLRRCRRLRMRIDSSPVMERASDVEGGRGNGWWRTSASSDCGATTRRRSGGGTQSRVRRQMLIIFFKKRLLIPDLCLRFKLGILLW